MRLALTTRYPRKMDGIRTSGVLLRSSLLSGSKTSTLLTPSLYVLTYTSRIPIFHHLGSQTSRDPARGRTTPRWTVTSTGKTTPLMRGPSGTWGIRRSRRRASSVPERLVRDMVRTPSKPLISTRTPEPTDPLLRGSLGSSQTSSYLGPRLSSSVPPRLRPSRSTHPRMHRVPGRDKRKRHPGDPPCTPDSRPRSRPSDVHRVRIPFDCLTSTGVGLDSSRT